ncbi:MAG: hypothetical protein ACREAA_07780 [Candidatus Polarisedimenticolia bacterium]
MRLPVYILSLVVLSSSGSHLEVVVGVDDKGRATDQWLKMLGRSGTAAMEKKLSSAEQAWADLIHSRLDVWNDRRGVLAGPFDPIGPPERALIVMGNRGGNDAFTHDPTTMGFDLSALQSAYGDATVPENRRRIDRFFDHEYTHLMQKAWLVDHPYPAQTPLRAALLDIWLEGLGNYRSLSDRWRAADGKASPATLETLAVLEPRLVARMSALACADADAAAPLTTDLSEGKFEAKWGALPAALWLEGEVSGDPQALRRFVLAGPDGIWDLAARRLPGPLRDVLAEARTAAAMCSAQHGGLM